MKLNDKDWLFQEIRDSNDQVFSWKKIWENHENVSPDPLFTRNHVPTDQERDKNKKVIEKRRERIEKYTMAVPKMFADLNVLCLAHFAHKNQPLFHDLMPLLEHYVYFEWMMNHDPVKPWYRDHLIHQLRVAFLGELFLKCPLDDQGLTSLDPSENKEISLCKKVAERIKQIIEEPATSTIKYLAESLNVDTGKITPELIRSAWWLAGLFHDTGYVFDFFAQLANTVQDVYSFPIPAPFAGLAETFKKQSAEVLFHFLEQEALAYREWLKTPGLFTDPNWKPPKPEHVASAGMGPAFLVQLFKKGHSAAGALNLLYVIESLIERGEVTAEFRFAAGLAALAILRHDTDGWRPDEKNPAELVREVSKDQFSSEGWLTTRPIAFEDDPLSFLLALCDHIQEWGRYKTEPGKEPNTEAIVYNIEKVEMNLENGILKIKPYPPKGRIVSEGDIAQYKKEKKAYFGKNGILNSKGFVNKIEFESVA